MTSDPTAPRTLVDGVRAPLVPMPAAQRFGDRATDYVQLAGSVVSPITGFIYAWEGPRSLPLHAAGIAAGAVGGTAAAYHGYKRHRGSKLAALLWFPLGMWFWPITIPVAFAQDFGRTKIKKNRRTSKRRRTSRSRAR